MKVFNTYYLILKLIFCILLAGIISRTGYSQRFTEYEVKAAYIFNFAKFVEFPDSVFQNKASPIILGIYGDDPFGEIIYKTYSDREVNGRKWIIKYFKDLDRIEKCHILFVAKIQMVELLKILNQVRNKSVLTVGDNITDFCQSGGIINFTEQNSKNRFEINNIEANKSKLIISSKLLILSKIVRTNELRF